MGTRAPVLRVAPLQQRNTQQPANSTTSSTCEAATEPACCAAQRPLRRRGRPSKYDPALGALVLAHMAAGASKTEVAAALGIHRDTLYSWARRHPDFADTLKRGETLAAAWWERLGRKNLDNPRFNYPGWLQQMRNRFGWHA